MSVDFTGMDFGDYRYQGPTNADFLQNLGQGVQIGNPFFDGANKPADDVADETSKTPAAPVKTAQDLYYEGLAAEKRESAKSFLRNLLTQYGLGSLASAVDSIGQDTTSEEGIAERRRKSQDYSTRLMG